MSVITTSAKQTLGCRETRGANARSSRLRTRVVCEHTFVTSQGSPYGRFRRALDRGNTLAALSAAAELEHVGLVDALALLLLLARDGDERRFQTGAVRWAARYAREAGDVGPSEAQAVLGLLIMLNGNRRTQAASALAQLFDRQQHLPAGELLLKHAYASELPSA
jgi:hypothetical protein